MSKEIAFWLWLLLLVTVISCAAYIPEGLGTYVKVLIGSLIGWFGGIAFVFAFINKSGKGDSL